MSLIIALEGVENSGTTTLSELLNAYFISQGVESKVVQNPGIKTVRFLNNLSKEDKDRSFLYPELENTNFKDKEYLWDKLDVELEVAQEELEIQLKRADLYFLDKSFLTLLAYTGYGLMRSKKDLDRLKNVIKDINPAHKSFYLEIDFSEMMLREMKKPRPQDKIWVNPDHEFYNRVVRGYRLETKNSPDIEKIKNDNLKNTFEELRRKIEEYKPNFYK